jgi:hydrogenase maturation protease
VTAVGARVIGVGERARGDDGVGPAVLARLRESGLPGDVDLVEVRDATALVPLLAGADPVIVVDAVVGLRPGTVRELRPDDLASRAALAVSSHGVGVGEAIELARVLNDAPLPSIRIVGIGVERPGRPAAVLSAPVAAAVERAAQRVRALIGA